MKEVYKLAQGFNPPTRRFGNMHVRILIAVVARRLRDRFCTNQRAWLSLLPTVTSIVFLCLAVPSVARGENTKYQGFGTPTAGGQGKPQYLVVNLHDSGPGSLRDALSQGNRHVVFDVGGEILLTRSLIVQGANITVDGFSAPHPGVTLKNYGLVIHGRRGAHDIIVRGLRVRNAKPDGIQIAYNAYNVVVDHVSIQGSADGNLDITYDSHDVTVSWSILAKPAGTEKNMLIKYNPSRVSLHHNIFVSARQRNPHVSIDELGTPATDTTLDMRNNLVWNWGGGHGTQVSYGSRANIVNNFYSNIRFSIIQQKKTIIICKMECQGSPASAARAYVAGNFSNDRFADRINEQGTEALPFPAPSVETTDACTAAHQVLADAGVKPRDTVDQRYLSAITLPSCIQVENQSYTTVQTHPEDAE